MYLTSILLHIHSSFLFPNNSVPNISERPLILVLDSGMWKALPAIKGSVSSLIFIKVEKDPGEWMELAHSNGMRSQPCLIAAGNFVDFQTKVVRLCLQNNVSNPAVSTDAASDQMASWPFINSWEAVPLDGRVVGTEKEVLILSPFS